MIVIFGAWLRYFFCMQFRDNFAYLLIPQGVIAMGQMPLMMGITKQVSNWFGSEERMIATALGAISMSTGLVIGNILPPLYISQEDAIEKEQGKLNVSLYLWDTAIIITCMAGPLIVLYQEKPP